MYAQVFNGRVLSVETNPFPVNPSISFVDIPNGIVVYPGYYYDGSTFSPPTGLTEEEQYNAERTTVETKYSAPWNGVSGGILTLLQMTIIAAIARGADTTALGVQYQTDLAAMNAEFQAIDQKYGV